MSDRKIQFIKLLPEFIRTNDQTGALAGFLEGCEGIYDAIDDIVIETKSFPDPVSAPCDILPYLANHVGVVLEACDPCGLQRIQIEGAVPLYSIKGTRIAYSGFLRSLGFDVGIDELYETSPDGQTFLERGPRWDDVYVLWDDAITDYDFEQGGPMYDDGVGVWDGDELWDLNSSMWDEAETILHWDDFGLEWDDNQERFFSSRINVHLDELTEGALISPCNPTGGLGPAFIRKVKGRLEQATPAHIEIQELNFGKILQDSMDMFDDDFSAVVDLLDGFAFAYCQYYGMFASETGNSAMQWDNTPTYAWDQTHTESNSVVTPLISWDRFAPELTGDYILYDGITGAVYSCPETDTLEISINGDLTEIDIYSTFFYNGALCSYDGSGGYTFGGDPDRLKDTLDIIVSTFPGPVVTEICVLN